MNIDISTFNFDCPVCGKHHGADVKTVIIEQGAFNRLEEVAVSLGWFLAVALTDWLWVAPLLRDII